MTKKTKSFLSLLLALCMIFTSLPLSVSADGTAPTKTEAGVSVTGVTSKTYGDANFTFTAEAAQPGTNAETWVWGVETGNDVVEIEGAINTATANVKILKAGSAQLEVVYESNTTKGKKVIDLIINKKALTITGVTAVERAYVESNTTVVLEAEDANLVGKVGSDDVTIKADSKKGTITDANVGQAKAVTTELELDGTKKDNYTLIQPSGVIVNITKATQGKVTGLTGEAATVSGGKGKIKDTTDKMEYSTDVNFTSPSGAQCAATATEVVPGTYYVRYAADANHNAGEVSDPVVVGPYVAPPKTEADVNVAGNEAKTYGDGNFALTATATQSGTNDQTWTWSVVSGNDVVQVEGATNTATANVKILKAGSAQLKVVYESDTTKGEKNVDLTINKKALTITGVTAVDRVYAEGDTSVELRAESANLVGKVGSDDVTIKADSKKGRITDANANVGQAKAVTTQLELDGEKKDSYSLTQPLGVTVNITKAAQGKVTGLTGEAPTVSDGKGKIKGTTDKMEYSTDVNFTSPSGAQCAATATEVAPGTYYVRLKGDDNHEPGEVSDQVVVGPYVAPRQNPEIELSKTGTFKFEIKEEGYTPEEETIFVVNKSLTEDTGSLKVELLGANKSAFKLKGADINNVVADTSRSFKISPMPNLIPNIYKATVRVSGAGIKDSKSFEVQFVVTKKVVPPAPPLGGSGSTDSSDSSNSNSGSTGSSGSVQRITPKTEQPKVEPKKEMPKDSNTPDAKTQDKKEVVQVIPELNLSISKETVEKIEKFEDVKTDSWYNNALSYAVERGLMNGISETSFAPNEKTTRGQLVQIFYRLAGQPEAKATEAFGDVAKDAYYNNAVAWASNHNIVKGLGDGNFGSNENITREQLAVFLYRFAQSQNKNVSVKADLAKFGDNTNVSSWAQEALAWAVANNLVKGVSESSLDPKGSATRAQIATIMLRYEALFAPKSNSLF